MSEEQRLASTTAIEHAEPRGARIAELSERYGLLVAWALIVLFFGALRPETFLSFRAGTNYPRYVLVRFMRWTPTPTSPARDRASWMVSN